MVFGLLSVTGMVLIALTDLDLDGYVQQNQRRMVAFVLVFVVDEPKKLAWYNPEPSLRTRALGGRGLSRLISMKTRQSACGWVVRALRCTPCV